MQINFMASAKKIGATILVEVNTRVWKSGGGIDPLNKILFLAFIYGWSQSGFTGTLYTVIKL